MYTRRTVLKTVATAGVAAAQSGGPIDRRTLVRRHNPVQRTFDPLAPLSVGNGEFAFTADITGLQTFPEIYQDEVALCTMSQWGWHTIPDPRGRGESDLRLAEYETWGRKVGYATSETGQKELYDWLRQNPHRLHLGRIGFDLARADFESGEQTLDLWTGVIDSRFSAKGKPVRVRTTAHPKLDAIAVEIESAEPIGIVFAFPYGSPSVPAADWKRPDAHRTRVQARTRYKLRLERELDNDRYLVSIESLGDAQVEQRSSHEFVLRGSGKFSFVCWFGQQALPAALPTAVEVIRASAQHWSAFWNSGGAVDLGSAADPRAKELERRIVLSQYLTAIQCSGTVPPQETGLTCNSRYGKFHLEMHWWHAVHFALWNRTPLLERSLPWYQKILASAKDKARLQGYTGARWPKMTAPDGRDSPSPIGPLLIWQQPHPIVYAELCYRAHPNRATLDRYRDIVFESAEFMASFAVLNEKTKSSCWDRR